SSGAARRPGARKSSETLHRPPARTGEHQQHIPEITKTFILASLETRPESGAFGGRPTVTIEEVVDPRAGVAQPAIGRRHVDLETVERVPDLRAIVHGDPDARLVGNDLAASLIRPAARSVPELLGTRLRADVLEMTEHAVAARLAAEERFLDRELDALEERRGPPSTIDPREHARESAAGPGVAGDWKRPPEPGEDARRPASGSRHAPRREARARPSSPVDGRSPCAPPSSDRGRTRCRGAGCGARGRRGSVGAPRTYARPSRPA